MAALAAGWSRRMIDKRVIEHRWRLIHPGVYALPRAPVRRRQLWVAATVTTPDSALSRASAGACWDFRPWQGHFEVVTRPGSGGPRRLGRLLVCRSQTLEGEVTRHEGVRITSAARTLLDLSPHLPKREVARCFREALRLRLTSVPLLVETLGRHQGSRGSGFLWHLAERYSSIPYTRTRSNPEARALEVLHDAGVAPPDVNVRVAREEADLVWRERKLIVEIDGPQFHMFREEDARKETVWRRAGFTVRRIPSGAVYTDPERLLRLAR